MDKIGFRKITEVIWLIIKMQTPRFCSPSSVDEHLVIILPYLAMNITFITNIYLVVK